MRVLLVSHRLPPEHSAGTEVYTADLAAELTQRGHEVTLFASRKHVADPDLSLHRRSLDHAGQELAVVEVTRNLFHERFQETWEDAGVDTLFGRLLDELKPDVVHFQHLMYLSAGCLKEASRRPVAVLYTLHDFWLLCPRFGQLRHPDGTLCEKLDFRRCGTCLPSMPWRQSDAARRVGAALAGIKRFLRIDLTGPATRLASRTRDEGEFVMPGSARVMEFEHDARQRVADLLRFATAHVDRFLCPSRFLAERHVREGLPEERVHVLPTGVDLERFARPERTSSDEVRVLFLGSLVPVKGAHVLLEAWEQLSPGLRAKGELTLIGPARHAPAYAADLRRRAAAVGADVLGAITREQVPEALAEADLLVVPSLWYENRPLVMLEAAAAGVPVLVSRLGGMAELVQGGRLGWSFEAGDVSALRHCLQAHLEDPESLRSFTPELPDIPDRAAFVENILEHYAAARGEVAR